MNEFEKAAVSIVKKPISSKWEPPALEAPFRLTISVNEWLRGGKEMKKRATTFDCNFILGSVAEVERVFSFAKYVLSDNRRCMTPQLF